MSTSPPAADTEQPRGRFQFSMARLLGAVTLLAVVFALIRQAPGVLLAILVFEAVALLVFIPMAIPWVVGSFVATAVSPRRQARIDGGAAAFWGAWAGLLCGFVIIALFVSTEWMAMATLLLAVSLGTIGGGLIGGLFVRREEQRRQLRASFYDPDLSGKIEAEVLDSSSPSKWSSPENTG